MSKGLGLADQELLAVPQTNDVWEANFVSFPSEARRLAPNEWLGVVVSRNRKITLATRYCEETPTVSDLAFLLSCAMRRPLKGAECRPRSIHLRDDEQSRELIPQLRKLGIEVVTDEGLSLCVKEAVRLFQKDQDPSVEEGTLK